LDVFGTDHTEKRRKREKEDADTLFFFILFYSFSLFLCVISSKMSRVPRIIAQVPIHNALNPVDKSDAAEIDQQSHG